MKKRNNIPVSFDEGKVLPLFYDPAHANQHDEYQFQMLLLILDSDL